MAHRSSDVETYLTADWIPAVEIPRTVDVKNGRKDAASFRKEGTWRPDCRLSLARPANKLIAWLIYGKYFS